MKVFMVRHGESQNNRDKLWMGWFDAPLTEKGREDAALVGTLLTNVRFDRIFSSDLSRARNTAEIAIPRCSYESSELLREISVGNLAVTPINLVDTEQRKAFSKAGYADFGGESRADFKLRVNGFMKSLETLGCESVAVFCHGGWLRQALDFVLDDPQPRARIICDNCAVGVFEFDGSLWKLDSAPSLCYNKRK